MPKYRNLDDFRNSVLRLAEEKGISDALVMISHLVDAVISRESSIGRVFTSKEVDMLCLELGSRATHVAPPPGDDSTSVFIATAIYKTGGHTRVIKDLMNADPGSKQFVILTNVLHDIKQENIPPFIDADHVSICPRMCFEGRVNWIQQELVRINPRRIYLLIHHFDCVAVASVQPGFGEHLFYVHNCDHSLSLGSHIPRAIHVDLHAKGFFQCRETENIKNNVMWPLVAERPNPPPRNFFSAFKNPVSKARIKSCTSGGFEKFESPHLRKRLPYAIRYAEVVPRIIAASGGVHLHIGNLSDTLLEDIQMNMKKAGISRRRFVHVPYVPKLSQALVDLGVDIYLTSFPLGGGLALVEAMSAGLPVIAHSNYRTNFFSDETQAYPGVMIWRQVSELEDTLRSVTKEDLLRHASLSRRFFEENHLPVYLKEAIADALAGKEQTPPKRPVYYPNALQFFLDEHAEEQISSEQQRGAPPVESKAEVVEENYAPFLAKTPWLVELEIAKFLCSVGLSRDGEFLWNRAMARKKKKKGSLAAQS